MVWAHNFETRAPEYKTAVLPIRLWGVRNVHIIIVGSQNERGQMSDLGADEIGVS